LFFDFEAQHGQSGVTFVILNWDQKIAVVIKESGLSVSAFADRLGIQRSGLSHILNGRNKPSIDLIEKLLLAFPEMDANYFFKADATSKKSPSLPVASPDEKSENRIAVRVIVCYSDATFDTFDPNETK